MKLYRFMLAVFVVESVLLLSNSPDGLIALTEAKLNYEKPEINQKVNTHNFTNLIDTGNSNFKSQRRLTEFKAEYKVGTENHPVKFMTFIEPLDKNIDEESCECPKPPKYIKDHEVPKNKNFDEIITTTKGSFVLVDNNGALRFSKYFSNLEDDPRREFFDKLMGDLYMYTIKWLERFRWYEKPAKKKDDSIDTYYEINFIKPYKGIFQNGKTLNPKFKKQGSPSPPSFYKLNPKLTIFKDTYAFQDYSQDDKGLSQYSSPKNNKDSDYDNKNILVLHVSLKINKKDYQLVIAYEINRFSLDNKNENINYKANIYVKWLTEKEIGEINNVENTEIMITSLLNESIHPQKETTHRITKLKSNVFHQPHLYHIHVCYTTHYGIFFSLNYLIEAIELETKKPPLDLFLGFCKQGYKDIRRFRLVKPPVTKKNPPNKQESTYEKKPPGDPPQKSEPQYKTHSKPPKINCETLALLIKYFKLEEENVYEGKTFDYINAINDKIAILSSEYEYHCIHIVGDVIVEIIIGIEDELLCFAFHASSNRHSFNLLECVNNYKAYYLAMAEEKGDSFDANAKAELLYHSALKTYADLVNNIKKFKVNKIRIGELKDMLISDDSNRNKCEQLEYSFSLQPSNYSIFENANYMRFVASVDAKMEDKKLSKEWKPFINANTELTDQGNDVISLKFLAGSTVLQLYIPKDYESVVNVNEKENNENNLCKILENYRTIDKINEFFNKAFGNMNKETDFDSLNEEQFINAIMAFTLVNLTMHTILEESDFKRLKCNDSLNDDLSCLELKLSQDFDEDKQDELSENLKNDQNKFTLFPGETDDYKQLILKEGQSLVDSDNKKVKNIARYLYADQKLTKFIFLEMYYFDLDFYQILNLKFNTAYFAKEDMISLPTVGKFKEYIEKELRSLVEHFKDSLKDDDGETGDEVDINVKVNELINEIKGQYKIPDEDESNNDTTQKPAVEKESQQPNMSLEDEKTLLNYRNKTITLKATECRDDDKNDENDEFNKKQYCYTFKIYDVEKKLALKKDSDELNDDANNATELTILKDTFVNNPKPFLSYLKNLIIEKLNLNAKEDTQI